MEHVKEILGLVTAKVADVAQGDVVVGDPIVPSEDVTIVPLSRVSIGFGGGGGEGEGTQPDNAKHAKRGRGGKGKGYGGGAGGGGKVRPVAAIVFTEEGVSVEPIPDRKGVFDKIIDKVPEVVDMMKDLRGK